MFYRIYTTKLCTQIMSYGTLSTISCPPSLMHRLVWGGCGGALLRLCDCLYIAYICGVYMGCIWENRVTEDSAGGGPCVRRAPPPCLALPASEQNPSIEYKNKTNSDTTATITNQTAHRLYSYTLHNIYYRTL